MGLIVGYSYLLYQQSYRSDQCIREVLNSTTDIKDYFGHKIETQNIWSHAQSYVANHYLYCMKRKERNE